MKKFTHDLDYTFEHPELTPEYLTMVQENLRKNTNIPFVITRVDVNCVSGAINIFFSYIFGMLSITCLLSDYGSGLLGVPCSYTINFAEYGVINLENIHKIINAIEGKK